MLDYGSSLFDLAVFQEQRAGRKVYLDFLSNPDPVNEEESFSLDELDPDVHSYLKNNESLLELPIDRLKKMNPLAIELYRMHGTDLCREPLEFTMNNQHMNGGILIDDWGRTSLSGCYAIGEAAGSHGVTRPGGAALNSGQVFGKRVAVAIRRSMAQKGDEDSHAESVFQAIESVLLDAEGFLSASKGKDIREIKTDIQSRMSDHAGILCFQKDVESALSQARELRKEIQTTGIYSKSASVVGQAFRWHQMAWVSEAVLMALEFYIRSGGGSRGARTICSDRGSLCPEASREDLSGYRFVKEQEQDKLEKILVKKVGEELQLEKVAIDLTPEVEREFFEKGWGNYLVKEG